MSTPKRLRILEAIRDRLRVVSQQAGYYTDIGRDVRLDARDPSNDDMPLAQVYFEAANVDQVKNYRHQVGQSITVVGWSIIQSQESEVLAGQILADIARAVELEDRTLGGLVADAINGLQPQQLETILPESGSNIVAARITYAAPYIRKYGDPEIA